MVKNFAMRVTMQWVLRHCGTALTIALLSACGLVKVAYLEMQPLTGFSELAGWPFVHFEPGAEKLAADIASLYPAAIETIEQTHGSPFLAQPNIFICATKYCYDKYAYAPTARGEARPRGNIVLINGARHAADGSARAILVHELSHVYWFSRGVRLPRWLEEGLGVWSSGGGGAEKITVADAQQSIRDGRVFYPLAEPVLFEGNPARQYDIDWPTFYRQSGMFVEYLHDTYPGAFRSMLAALREKRALPDAVQQAYGQSLETLWKQWLASVSKA
jgi:hypothetical protein